MISNWVVQADYFRTSKATDKNPKPEPKRYWNLVEMEKGARGRYNFRDPITVQAPAGSPPDQVGHACVGALVAYRDSEWGTLFDLAVLTPAEQEAIKSQPSK